MPKTNDGGPAFSRPHSEHKGKIGTEADYAQTGMSLRDYFAAMAMQGLMSQRGKLDEAAATRAYGAADLMLKVRGTE